jgi:hypothetical protein
VFGFLKLSVFLNSNTYLTTSPPHHLTTSPPHHLTTSPPHHLTTSPPHHLTTSPPHHLTTSPPHHLTTSPPHHLTTSPLCPCSGEPAATSTTTHHKQFRLSQFQPPSNKHRRKRSSACWMSSATRLASRACSATVAGQSATALSHLAAGYLQVDCMSRYSPSMV